MYKRLVPGLCLVAAIVAFAAYAAPSTGNATLSDPPMQSIGALEFGSDGVLFASDSQGATVYALEVGSAAQGSDGFTTVSGLDAKIAAMLGAPVHDVYIKDMAVDQASGSAYLSIMRGSGQDASPVLMKVSPDGEIHHVAFAGLGYTKLDLIDAPEAAPEARRNPRSYTVTDMELIEGQLYIAGLSNEEFSSALRRSSYPFEGDTKTTGLEIYHGAHGQFETHAPVYTFMPIELGGEPHVLAGYLCTPLVAFSVADLESGSRLRGKTIAEMGSGNVPIDMIAIEQDGEQYVVMTNTRRGTMKMKVADIQAAFARDGIVAPVGPRTGVDYLSAPLGHVVQIDEYDADSVLILDRNPENGSLSLTARGKDRL